MLAARLRLLEHESVLQLVLRVLCSAVRHLQSTGAVADRTDLPVHVEPAIGQTRHFHGDDILASGLRSDFGQ